MRQISMCLRTKILAGKIQDRLGVEPKTTNKEPKDLTQETRNRMKKTGNRKIWYLRKTGRADLDIGARRSRLTR
jgi:hypothetical protein